MFNFSPLILLLLQCAKFIDEIVVYFECIKYFSKIFDARLLRNCAINVKSFQSEWSWCIMHLGAGL